MNDFFKTEHLFQNGGPIIGIQIENEYANCCNTKTKSSDYEYMKFLNQTWTKDIGIDSLYFASENNILGNKDHGSLNGVLMTANLYHNGTNQLNAFFKNTTKQVSNFFLFLKLILL